MVPLQVTHPDVHIEFQKDNFVVYKTSKVFLEITTDQAHEQANTVINGDGGVIGIAEDRLVLRM